MIPLATLTQYVENVAGVQVQIACEADGTFLTANGESLDGYVLPFTGTDGHVLHIRQSLCNAASNVDRKQSRTPSGYIIDNAGQRADLQSGPALLTILHEAFHIALPNGTECQVESAAIANLWQLVRQFKLPAYVSRMELAGAQWNHERLPANYLTGVC